jgi:hypothetical protein
MGQTVDKTRDLMNNGRWDNHPAFGDQVDHNNLQTTRSRKVKRSAEHFSLYGSDDLRANIETPSCWQYEAEDVLAVKPLSSDEIINEHDDDENWADPGATCSGRCRPGDGNDNVIGDGEEDEQGGENRTGKATGKKDGKGTGKGKRMGNSNGKGIVKQTPGGDDISHAVALQLEMK